MLLLHPSRRVPRALAVALSAFLLLLIVPTLLRQNSARADVLPEPQLVSSDNAVTCKDAGLSGDVLISGGVYDRIDGLSGTEVDAKTLNVVNTGGFTITGVVVKGGHAYNIYRHTLTDLVAPLVGVGNIPTISHWFVCGSAPTAVTPVAPEVTPADCVNGELVPGSFRLPTAPEGITYSSDGNLVIATADEGYVLGSAEGWTGD
ncbi:MAG: hypothetical protein ACTHOD_20855, partial [Motilibacteraceae bacterium]